MQGSHQRLVKRRLILINTVIVLTSIVGFISIFEVARGVGFHESNIQHLGLNSEFQKKVMMLNSNSTSGIEEIQNLLIEIRKEPDNCLATRNPLLDIGTKILGTSGIYDICQHDTDIIGDALAMIPAYQAGEIDEARFLEQFENVGQTMHQHSFEFRPLISRTVQALLIIAGVIILLKGFAVAVISILSSRSIIRQFQKVVNMESELRKNNVELKDSVIVLKSQKIELEKQKVELATAQQLAEYNAKHDTLTGLPNRRYLDIKLAEMKDGGDQFAIFHIDIDGFKQINDTRGHRAGDYVLTKVARRLESLSDELELIARVGGDEFVLFATYPQNKQSSQLAEQLAKRVVTLLEKPVTFEEFDCRISASVGIAIGSTKDKEESSSDKILVDADLAMYHQKLRGKNGFSFYSKSLRQQMIEKKQLADDIHRALEAREFIPYYQIQVESNTFRITGAEALVRWQHPTRGLLTPEKFLPVASEMGVLGDVDRMVFKKSYTDFTEWDELKLNVHRLSVNMSFNRLMDPMLMEELQQYDLTHGRLSFELVESILLDGCDDDMQATINRLNALGIQLELDDFGSGHASIIGLLALNPKRFKIDRQLVSSICNSTGQRALIKSIIDIGKSMNVKVVAEGVETIEQAHLLGELGCDYLQGFYFSKPISHEIFIDFVRHPPYLKVA